MENRRLHYRHAIDASERIAVLFQSADGGDLFSAEIVDLSIGGMCVHAGKLESMSDQPWLAVFSLESRQLRMMVKRVYSGGDRPGHAGFHFVPPADLARKDEQERAIWKFLLEKQRQERKQRQAASRLTG